MNCALPSPSPLLSFPLCPSAPVALRNTLHAMDAAAVEQLVLKLKAVLLEAASDPLAISMLGSLAFLAFSVALLFACASHDRKKAAQAEAGGTVFEGGVRRSTR
mgnify:CR=1 FL=1